MSNIALNPTQRLTLESLTQVTSLFNRTQERLNTDRKVNTATDDPASFFRAQSLSDRATAILGQKTNIDQSVQAVNAALDGTSSAATLLNALQGVLVGARSGSLNQRISATKAFETLGNQLAQLVKDSSFQGLDLLTSTSASLATQFSDRTSATLTIQGFNLAATATANARTLFTQAVSFSAAGLVFSQVVADSTLSIGVGGFSALDLAGSAGGGTVAASTAEVIFDATASRLATAVTQLQGISAQLGANVAILQARANFSSNYSNTLTSGVDALTLADLNTEAANSQALSLRQQLGIQSLSGSAAANSSILNLLK